MKRKHLLYFLPLAVCLVLGVYLYVGLSLDPRRLESTLIDRPVPDLVLKSIKGYDNGFSTEDLKGQVTLVNIFGSWCVACRAEHPFLMTLKERNAVPIYGIDWRERDPDAGPAWLERYGNPYTKIGDDPESRAAIAFGVTGAPESFVVDKQGIIRFKYVGPVQERVWEETIRPIVEELRRR